MKNEGAVLHNDEQIKKRWVEYFNHLLNEENERVVFEDDVPNRGVTTSISREEAIVAVQKMKSGKVTGRNETPIELWKCLGETLMGKLLDLCSRFTKKYNGLYL